MTERHRPSEPFSPRPSDLIADRLRVLAAWATRCGAAVVIDGRSFDGEALTALADAQSMDEAALVAHFRAFRGYYVAYTDVLRERERFLHAAIAALEAQHRDLDARRALRLCKLRRPPLAKVRAIGAPPRRASNA